jgi:hypothetical protein
MFLEKIIEKELGKEVTKHFRDNVEHYPQVLKNNCKEMFFPFCVGAIATYYAQSYSQEIFNNEIKNSLAGYVAGYAGLLAYFGVHFIRNKEKYFGEENKGRKFEYIRDFVITDYFADVISYAPIYGFVDQILQRTPEIQNKVLGFHLEAGETGVVASFTGMVTYILTMSALMPVSQEISKRGRIAIKESVSQGNGKIVKDSLFDAMQHIDKYVHIVNSLV